jgi:pimeloyl-ACP methyl ester carboxylesterase
MAQTSVRGVTIHYEVLGEQGPWITLSPGGRRGMDGVLELGTRLAEEGYRVLLHDRRNCGASDVVIEGDEAEFEIWADDLYELLGQVGARPAFAGGSSSGCRLALLLALRHPDAVRGLLLWRVTGGQFAAQRLAQQYYGDFIDAARRGGMAAVCETEFMAERIASNPTNRDRLMAMSVDDFAAVMGRWRDRFLQDAELPVIGASAEALGAIRVPACVVPGHDRTHPRHVGEEAARLLPDAELRDLMGEDVDADLAVEAWDGREDELAAIFSGFLSRVSSTARV